ncbi:MAG TPA: hypothetical protein VGV93_07805 [Acidimicrobiales bacterium]|nr:hypothetical protein [Acidimicrobiales bacterium]
MSSPALDAALAAGDLDELLRWVDRLAEGGEWDRLVELRRRCRTAFERSGHQLWPITSQVEYRLALEAPANWAALTLVEGAGRFALGPLSEVAASTHTWADLSPHLTPGPVAGLVAHERVLRGEATGGEEKPGTDVLELPLALQPWEPAYAVATYRADGAEFPSTPLPPLRLRTLPAAGLAVGDAQVPAALAALVEPWVVESNGTAATVAVRGTAEAAIAALGHGEARVGDLRSGPALAAMAWAGASGGAHGRRRGAAVGRFGAWWALSALAGLLDDWPVPPADLGAAASELRWLHWQPASGPTPGWSLHLAIEDPEDNLAWAIAAVDQT